AAFVEWIGISPELVQAEVARQLERQFSEFHEELGQEKRRTGEAVKEARRCREDCWMLRRWEWLSLALYLKYLHIRDYVNEKGLAPEFTQKLPQAIPHWSPRYDAVLRAAKTEEEWNAARDVSVQLAGGGLYAADKDRDVWKEVIQWAALSGKIGTIVARDCPTTPLDQDSRDYVDEMGLSDVYVDKFVGDRCVRLAKLNSDAAWKLHVSRNHQPFRRDCSICERNGAAWHQHRSTAHPMAYSLSVDVGGPLKGYGRSPDGKFFKYSVNGAMRILKIEDADGHGDFRGYPIPPPPDDD
ncbi:unnamed protein product, partial [Symbiodinium necroappetens]